MDDKTRVVVIHKDCMMREGLVSKLQENNRIQVCAVTPNLTDVPKLIKKKRPQLILTNIAPKCSRGAMSLKKLRRDFPQVKILTFSCNSEFQDFHAELALSSGVDGYVSSADTLEGLLDAVQTVCDGKRYVSPRVVRRRKRIETAVPGFKELSRREAEVFCLTGCGYVTKRIAEEMNLKVKTVESYRERIRKKLQLAKGSDLLYAAVSFMRHAAWQGDAGRGDLQMIRELLSATA